MKAATTMPVATAIRVAKENGNKTWGDWTTIKLLSNVSDGASKNYTISLVCKTDDLRQKVETELYIMLVIINNYTTIEHYISLAAWDMLSYQLDFLDK